MDHSFDKTNSSFSFSFDFGCRINLRYDNNKSMTYIFKRLTIHQSLKETFGVVICAHSSGRDKKNFMIKINKEIFNPQ